jgi:ubiquitin conjugation factor E4 B
MQPTANYLTRYLLNDPESDHGICHDFLAEIASRFDEDEQLKDVVNSALNQLVRRLGKMTMNDDYQTYVMVR